MPVTLNNTNITINDGTNNFVLETVKTHVPEVDIDIDIVPPVITNSEGDPAFELLTYTHSGGSENQTEFNLTINEETTCDILIIGGGGGGGARFGGGGGAGLLIYKTNQTLQGDITIKIGKGGLGAQNGSGSLGANGEDSLFITATESLTAIGGGGGGKEHTSGKSGGSGGGGSWYNSNGGSGSGDNITTFGYDGGNGYVNGVGTRQTGGGGGAGGAGKGAIASERPDGGRGKQIDITGTNIYYAGGGGGSNSDHDSWGYDATGEGGENLGSGWGGMGGGGGGDGGETSPSIPAQNGAPNSGGGGGGGVLGAVGGNGGSGIVIIKKYLKPVALYEDTTHQLQNLAEQKTGVKGWRLVRFLPLSLGRWYTGNYFTTTNMEVTDSIGNAYDYTNEFMVPFGTYDEIWFGTYDMQYWVYTYKSSVLGNYSDSPRNVISSSENPNPHTIEWYNRTGASIYDPVITHINYGDSGFHRLYIEDESTSAIPQNGGMCVFVRSSTDTVTVNPEPVYKTLTFTHKAVGDLVYDFTPYNDLTRWNAYATSIGATYYNTSFSQGGIYHHPGNGWIELVLPSNYTYVSVFFGNPHSGGTTYLYIDGVSKSSCSPGQTKTYSQSYTSGQTLKILESAGIIHPDLIITLSSPIQTQTEYTVNFPEETECDILIVGGGGGGGRFGGGGGGGGVLFKNNITLNGTYTIKTAKGGTGAPDSSGNGNNGDDSSIIIDGVEYIAKGGGGGGTRTNGGDNHGRGGNNGGSGGGGSHSNTSTTANAGGSSIKNTYIGWESYGYNGGEGKDGTTGSPDHASGGGGGAGSVGSGITSTGGGNGGAGKEFISYFGTNVGHNGWFGGGGGGNTYINAGNPGYANGGNGLFGGGGIGGYDGTTEINAGEALPNTGGGGGGSKYDGGTVEDIDGGDGGSGIVIIRYKTKYIRQHPAYDAQWTYHSANPNVHHYGNVGIGTLASETNKLTVKGDINVIGDIYENNNKIAYGWDVYGNSVYNQYGNVGIGTNDPRYALHTTGIIYAGQGGITETGSTTWTITSDNRIKENIEKASYDICSENIKNINLYRFNYNTKYVKTTDKNQLGFIAQDVRKYFPKAVKNKTTRFDNDVVPNLLSVDVTQLNYTMYGAVKHIGQDIDAIKEKLGITEVPTEIKNEPYAIEVVPFNDPDAELPIVNEEPATN